MRFLVVVAIAFFLLSDPAHAQRVGTCSPAVGEAYLDVGNVRARIPNNGGLFQNGSPSVYEVPKGGGQHAVSAAGLWVGGLVEDSLRIAAARYGNYEFWAGPLDSLGQPPRDCSVYDPVAVLYRDDIERYERFGQVTSRLQAWPWQWGAPVVDGDGNPANYNLAGGDRPELLGDQTLWWVMNDVGNVHGSTDSPPLGLQVSVAAFAFNTAGALGNSTFYRYRLWYKGEAPLEDAYVGLFLDTDLGNFQDDYVGADTMLAMGYTYNADDNDNGHYGAAPPALGVSLLQGPIAEVDSLDNDHDSLVDEPGERLRATAVTYFNGSGTLLGDPTTGMAYYNYMRARWPDGEPITFGGYARGFSSDPISFVYPGDPVTRSYWSEVNADNEGNPNPPSDRRFVVAAGPFHMQPEDIEDVVFVIVWSRGTSNLDSVRKLREDMAYIQSIKPLVLEPRIAVGNAVPSEQFVPGNLENYPNPFVQQTTIRYSLGHPEHATLTVYDILGREVDTLVDRHQDAGWHEAVFDAAGLTAGVYVYRLQVGRAVATETMVVAQ